MTCTKATIAEEIQYTLGCTKHASVELVETLMEIMKRDIETGHDLLVSGFGKFRVNEKKIRRGRNPATGEDMQLPARRVVTFKCSRSLREHINRGEKKRNASPPPGK